jgi:hypothetical protein
MMNGHGSPAATDQLGDYGHLFHIHDTPRFNGKSRLDGLYQTSVRSDSSESQVLPTEHSDHSERSEHSVG